ncbi:SgrR family transcriptional regulator [Vibrio algarum]|uniref:SgrR family transcriptional regulator n=1 Tax=Vibrio algarum TaxID=3020714 RepID=A0ABT4YXD8_9VIBR|nr:SgrR family transcriptional regulator [Vibrio sp. KJ40-1]MDB1126264.1 SgrR family transcriptional regulator [Vibrio sp. KJ40-1]
MSSPRLRTQFESLFEHFKGQDSDIQLDEIISILFCTRRNARIVLNKMADQGWIEWHPAAGRGNLSTIIFKRNQQDVSESLAKKYLDEGRIEQAFSVLKKDAGKLTKVIEDYLGVTHDEGLQYVRLPYYRQLSMLNPTKPHRRSEQNIIRQIFSGLTKLDENDQLQPDLAHTWESNDGKNWRFYLRPGVRFHNGDLLQVNHIVDSITILSGNCSFDKKFSTSNSGPHTLFGHIFAVSSPEAWVIDIALSVTDWHLPLLLAESNAKIMPPTEWISSKFDLIPIGTGPYKVKLNNEKRLVLEAFDNYFGYRPLVDVVEVWVIDQAYSSMVFPSLSNPIKGKSSDVDGVKLDPGCTFLLLNRKNGLAKDEHWANYFCSTLSSFNLYRLLPEETIIDLGLLPAYGLKPGWQHSRLGTDKCTPPSIERVTVAYHAQHPVFPALAKTIAKLLAKDKLIVEFKKYQHYLEDLTDVDIWLKPMGIGTDRDDALAGWLMNYSNVNEMSNSSDFVQWCGLVEGWRRDKNTQFPARKLGKALVESKQIIPLFHCWLGVNKEHCGTLQNATCNALGWFDFSGVWVKPKNTR